MDHRESENLRVKKAIASSLMKYLRLKDLEDISIAEITRDAGVSRMAFYRNFETKTDVLRYYFGEVVFQDTMKDYPYKEIDFWSTEYGRVFFSGMQKHREEVLLLDRLNMSMLLLETFMEKNEELAGDMPASSIERYQVYFAAGASLCGCIKWLRDGCREAPEEINQCLYQFMNPTALQK